MTPRQKSKIRTFTGFSGVDMFMRQGDFDLAYVRAINFDEGKLIGEMYLSEIVQDLDVQIFDIHIIASSPMDKRLATMKLIGVEPLSSMKDIRPHADVVKFKFRTVIDWESGS